MNRGVDGGRTPAWRVRVAGQRGHRPGLQLPRRLRWVGRPRWSRHPPSCPAGNIGVTSASQPAARGKVGARRLACDAWAVRVRFRSSGRPSDRLSEPICVDAGRRLANLNSRVGRVTHHPQLVRVTCRDSRHYDRMSRAVDGDGVCPHCTSQKAGGLSPSEPVSFEATGEHLVAEVIEGLRSRCSFGRCCVGGPGARRRVREQRIVSIPRDAHPKREPAVARAELEPRCLHADRGETLNRNRLRLPVCFRRQN